jgi:hypothetical protein
MADTAIGANSPATLRIPEGGRGRSAAMETFIVRVWAPEPSFAPDDGPPTHLRGVVRRVRDGREASFSSWDQLRPFLELIADGDRPAAGPAGEGTQRPGEIPRR